MAMAGQNRPSDRFLTLIAVLSSESTVTCTRVAPTSVRTLCSIFARIISTFIDIYAEAENQVIKHNFEKVPK